MTATERFRVFLPVFLTGTYAWFVGVAALVPNGSWLVRSCAIAAWLALVTAGFLESRWQTFVGLYGFLGASAACWILVPGSATSLSVLIGWVAFTLAWGALVPRRGLERVDPGPVLAPRSRPSRTAAFLPICFGAVGLFLLFRPLSLERPGVRVLALVLALAGALAALRVGSALGSEQQVPTEVRWSSVWTRARGALFLLVVAIAACVWWVREMS